jgi:isoaspartyl peptidase/L-asparaginase-like protein (Ntn-hydrolase superfamily)
MEFKGYTLKQAAEQIIFQILPKDSGGIIAVDKDYNFELLFNTPSMLRGIANSEGMFDIKIWK